MAEEKPADNKAEPTDREMIKAMHDSMVSLHKRMDALEGKGRRDRKDDKDFKEWAEEEEKEPEHKADAEGEEGEEERKDDDDKRKDDDDDKRKDAEEGEKEPEGEKAPVVEEEEKPKEMASDKRKDDDDRRHDSALRRRIEALERDKRNRRVLTDEELNALAERQHEWDQVAQAHGERASRPLDGESIETYDRRHAKRFQKHSPKWKDVDLASMPAGVVSKIIAPEIRTDSIAAAYRMDNSPAAVLREIRKPDRTGRIISEFVGPVSATLAPFRLPAMRVKRINNQSGAY